MVDLDANRTAQLRQAMEASQRPSHVVQQKIVSLRKIRATVSWPFAAFSLALLRQRATLCESRAALPS